tara:strand:+ start:1747 stop:2472 length:726 start_codon:yes stop_codon:yes gene_type:complete
MKQEMKPLLTAFKDRNTSTDYRYDLTDNSSPTHLDLRRRSWKMKNQFQSGACVGFAVTGVMEWHTLEDLSPNFLWMCSKESDTYKVLPTTALTTAGTYIKDALSVAKKHGCLTRKQMPMGRFCNLSQAAYVKEAAKNKIKSYYNVGRSEKKIKAWLHEHGPLVTHLTPDPQFMAFNTKRLANYKIQPPMSPGHAVIICGYTTNGYIIKNSWGTRWGRRGYGYMDIKTYANLALKSCYGITV